MRHRWKPAGRGSPDSAGKILRTFKCKVCKAVVTADVTVGITEEKLLWLRISPDCSVQVVSKIMEA